MTERTCRWPGCEPLAGPTRRGLCRKHYLRAWRLGDMGEPWLAWSRAVPEPCRWPKCDTDSRARGFCAKHYQRAKTAGDYGEPWQSWPSRERRKPGPAPDMSPCRWPDCLESNYSRGFCVNHYYKARIMADYDAPWLAWVKTCYTCGSQYEPVRHRKSSRENSYCSEACRHKGKRLTHPKRERDRRRDRYYRKRAATASPDRVTSTALRARDGDHCYLCEEPIDFDLSWPAPHSPSLDHVVPLSRGGAHSLQNTAMAHLVCNLRKGARLVTEMENI